MSTTTVAITSRTQLSGAAAAINSLSSGTYVVLGTITFASGGKVPLDAKVEVYVTPGTVSGALKQFSVFAQESLDGTNFGTGPTSGTSTTDELNLRLVMTIPCNTNSTLQRGFATLAPKFGSLLPYAVKLIGKNETGAALAASGNDVYYLTASGDTV